LLVAIERMLAEVSGLDVTLEELQALLAEQLRKGESSNHG
jgi:hypothetical protein